MNYDDIINFPHHVSKTRKRMSLYERSAQFAPFDALEGYMDQVKEVSRITQKEKEISEETKIIINDKLNNIEKNISLHPFVRINYFIKDSKKSGGKYTIISGNVKRIDSINSEIILMDNKKISIKDITNIE